MKKVRITKLTDDKFEGQHPNGIYEGYVREGMVSRNLEIGERFWVGGTFSTSPVTQINEDNTFKTLYSTYKIEYLD